MAAINAKEFIQDVQAGMSDTALQAKYGMSGKQFFMYKAAVKDYLAKEKQKTGKGRKVSAKEILADIKADLSDDEIMDKYNFTRRQLQSVLRQLINAGLATPKELSNRLSITRSQVTEAFVETGKAIHELD